MFLMLKHLSWHSWYKCFNKYNLLCIYRYYGYNSSSSGSFDRFWSIWALIFGIIGGSYNFLSFASGFNTMARLSFGLLDYDEYMSDGYGQGYEGIGLGNSPFLNM